MSQAVRHPKVWRPQGCLESTYLAVTKVVDDEGFHRDPFALPQYPARIVRYVSLRLEVHIGFNEQVIFAVNHDLWAKDFSEIVLQPQQEPGHFVPASMYFLACARFEDHVIGAELTEELSALSRIEHLQILRVVHGETSQGLELKRTAFYLSVAPRP
jgi:hypothetical protein